MLRKKTVVFLFILLMVGALGWHTAHAQGNTGAANVIWGNFSQGEFQNILGLGDQDPRITAAKIIRALLGFLGVIAVVLILYAGFVWMTSGGNDEKISKAKGILRNAVIGLLIILASFGIVSFIITRIISSTGGGNGNGGGGSGGGGIGGLGNGIVKSVYPEPFQQDVPRNTAVIVTFREKVKAATICQDVTGTGDCAPGTHILPGSVRIFRSEDSTPTYVTDVTVTSDDNETFIFRPAAALGEQNGDVNYTVNLTTDIKKADGSAAFSLSTGFTWGFEVSNQVDLESPRLLNFNQGGIFPPPDDGVDTISGTTAPVAAQATLTVASVPSPYRAATAVMTRTAPPSLPTNGTVSGINRCTAGTVSISIVDNGGVLKARVSYSQSGLQPAELNIIGNRFDIAPCHLTVNLDAGYVAGHSWRIAVTPEAQADTLTVGSKMYTFVTTTPNDNQIALGSTPAATAVSIRDAVNAIHPQVTATASGNTVTFKAKVAGSAGNRLELSTSNPVALSPSAFSGGADQTTLYTVNDLKDQPKNTVIQVNFNEGINPLTISGTSVEVADKLRIINAEPTAKTAGQACSEDKDCRSYKCTSNVCEGDQLAGKFVVSNQYKTAEFISDSKCGVNGCGENIYCLPANSHLRVEVEAATLQSCSTNSDCTISPYSTCVSGVCQNPEGKNYPTAASLNGLVDIANNSFDGNRNTNPQGKVDTWNENLSTTDNGDRGDNYRWSFWVSDRLDLSTPTIQTTSVNNNQSGIGLSTAVEVLFSKLMLASSLTSGSITVNNGLTSINHHLINFWSRAGSAVGYWISKIDKDLNPVDGRNDQTAAIISHGTLTDSTEYRAQVGSGVKDIYQNCYKPSSGPTCASDPLNPSCCRNTSGDLAPTSILNAQGNCPL